MTAAYASANASTPNTMLVTGPPATKLNMALRSPRVLPGTLDTTPPAKASLLLSRQPKRPSGSRWNVHGPHDQHAQAHPVQTSADRMPDLVDSESQEGRDNHECDGCNDGGRRPSLVSGRAGGQVSEERDQAQRQADSEAEDEQESCRASDAASDCRVPFRCRHLLSSAGDARDGAGEGECPLRFPPWQLNRPVGLPLLPVRASAARAGLADHAADA